MKQDYRALRRTPRRAVPAAVTALGLIVLGGGLGWIGGTQLITGQWPRPVSNAVAQLAGTPWASTLGWLVAGVAVVIGVVLVVAAVSPVRSRSLPLTVESGPHVRVGAAFLTGGGLARLAAVQARDVDGADDVTATLAGKRLRVDVATPLVDTADLKSRLRTRLQTALDKTGVRPLPKIDIRVRHRAVPS